MSRDLVVNRFTSTAQGLVPAPGQSVGALLRDDGTWQSFLSVALAGNVTIAAPSTATRPLTITTNSGLGEGTRIVGTNTGNANTAYMTFFQSDNATRAGYVGKGGSSDANIYLVSDLGGIGLGVNGASSSLLVASTGAVTIAAPSSNASALVLTGSASATATVGTLACSANTSGAGVAAAFTGRGGTVAGLILNSMAATGSAIPTLGSNKPGGPTSPSTWIRVLVDGVSLQIPCWA